MGFNFGAFAGGAATGFAAGFEMAQKYKEREDKRKQEEQDAINKASKERQDNIKDATKALGDYMSDREKNLAIYNDGSASTKDRNIAYGTLKGSAAKLSSLASGYDLKKYPEIGKLLEITNSDLKSFNSSMEMLKDYEAENGNKYVVPFSANLKGATVDDAGNLRFKKMDETGKFTNELLDISIEPSEIAEQKDYGSKTMYRYDETTGKQDSVVVKSQEEYDKYSGQGFGDIKHDTTSTNVSDLKDLAYWNKKEKRIEYAKDKNERNKLVINSKGAFTEKIPAEKIMYDNMNNAVTVYGQEDEVEKLNQGFTNKKKEEAEVKFLYNTSTGKVIQYETLEEKNAEMTKANGKLVAYDPEKHKASKPIAKYELANEFGSEFDEKLTGYIGINSNDVVNFMFGLTQQGLSKTDAKGIADFLVYEGMTLDSFDMSKITKENFALKNESGEVAKAKIDRIENALKYAKGTADEYVVIDEKGRVSTMIGTEEYVKDFIARYEEKTKVKIRNFGKRFVIEEKENYSKALEGSGKNKLDKNEKAFLERKGSELLNWIDKNVEIAHKPTEKEIRAFTAYVNKNADKKELGIASKAVKKFIYNFWKEKEEE